MRSSLRQSRARETPRTQGPPCPGRVESQLAAPHSRVVALLPERSQRSPAHRQHCGPLPRTVLNRAVCARATGERQLRQSHRMRGETRRLPVSQLCCPEPVWPPRFVLQRHRPRALRHRPSPARRRGHSPGTPQSPRDTGDPRVIHTRRRTGDTFERVTSMCARDRTAGSGRSCNAVRSWCML